MMYIVIHMYLNCPNMNYFDGLAQHYSISSALAMQIP